jgi:uncharacterized membrane protein YjjB (DUF3815 family)
MKIFDYLLIIGCIASLVACTFFAEGSWQRDVFRFIGVFCVGGFVGRLGGRLHKKNNK